MRRRNTPTCFCDQLNTTLLVMESSFVLLYSTSLRDGPSLIIKYWISWEANNNNQKLFSSLPNHRYRKVLCRLKFSIEDFFFCNQTDLCVAENNEPKNLIDFCLMKRCIDLIDNSIQISVRTSVKLCCWSQQHNSLCGFILNSLCILLSVKKKSDQHFDELNMLFLKIRLNLQMKIYVQTFQSIRKTLVSVLQYSLYNVSAIFGYYL